MANKLPKGVIPGNGSFQDFQCFGPVASKDGDFANAMMADLGCFKQGKVDSNKMYHGAVVQCRSTGGWFVYYEWGRTGAKNPQFQFMQCNSKEEAHAEFEDQMHAKNDKRGIMLVVSGVATLDAKPGKDVYLVREQAGRTCGLPDAKNIVSSGVVPTKVVKSGKKISLHPEVDSLLRAINKGTVAYTRASTVGNDLPSQKAINEARPVLTAARLRINAVGHDVKAQTNDRELILLTNTLYSRIAKIKARGASAEEWILNQRNIDAWELDLDAFESALGAVKVEVDDNPYGDLPVELEWLGSERKPETDMAKWICQWMPRATRNKHNYLGECHVYGIWAVHRTDGLDKIESDQKEIKAVGHRPMFQEMCQERPDLSPTQRKLWHSTNTSVLFHGTRSCNLRGILQTTLRLRTELIGVKLTAAMFGEGHYWADDFKKSAGYTSHPDAYYTHGAGAITGRKAHIFLADVVLGNCYLAEGAKAFAGAPKGYDSVFGKCGKTNGWNGPLKNNEFITYKPRQNNLKYLVEFECR